MENFVGLSTVQQDRFEQMAYRLHKGGELEDDQSDYGCVSLAGIIELQPNRRKGNRTWRPMQASDLGEPGSIGHDASLHFHPADDMDGAAVGSVVQDPFDSSYTRPSVSLHPPSTWGPLGDKCDDGMGTVEKPATFAQDSNKGIHQSEMHYAVTEPYMQLLGKLPDPVHLQEQTGKFDGQVVFTGHANRDISAHQWSSSSFQWVNIGRYSHSRGKVEGSLASDRLRGTDEPRDTLAYFKLAAENREALVIQNGRTKDHSTTAGHAIHTGTDVAPWTQPHSDASMKASHISSDTKNQSRLSLPLTVRVPFRGDVLEDPFVAAASASLTQSRDGGYVQDDLIDTTGSLDLTYQFPMNAPTTTSQSDVGADTLGRKSTQTQTLHFLPALVLGEFPFDGGSATQRDVTLSDSECFQGMSSVAPQNSVRGRSQLLNNAKGSQPALPGQDGVAHSTTSFDPTARYALSTPSVASLTYVASNLSATAVPYAKTQAPATGSEPSESNASTVNATAVGLHYSDPDGLRKPQKYEVTNGLGQQAPTLQNFKGPFFTETKPTTHDPTVALSVRTSEAEKLLNWFRDGHRPARQKEYTKSLIAAATARGKGRHFGAVGEAPTTQENGPHANTAPFVRLYENLSEYVEEYRNGSRQSYFTRRWKLTALHHRDSGPDSNMSYFSKGRTAPLFSKGVLLKPSERM